MKEKFSQEALSPDERKAFMKEAQGLMGDDLETLVEQTINKKRTSEKAWSMSAECDWLDEKDLKDRFKSRPDKVEKIMERGRQMECPLMGCTMYGIPKYASLDKETTKEIDETSANASQETKVKKAKAAAKPKAKAEAKASGGCQQADKGKLMQ